MKKIQKINAMWLVFVLLVLIPNASTADTYRSLCSAKLASSGSVQFVAVTCTGLADKSKWATFSVRQSSKDFPKWRKNVGKSAICDVTGSRAGAGVSITLRNCKNQ
jgi:hypothetical protein